MVMKLGVCVGEEREVVVKEGEWGKVRPKQYPGPRLQVGKAGMATEGTSQSDERRHVLRLKTMPPVK